ncbi:MAG TPA: hypothetical protein PKA10_09370 [Selenomonadales bacterium]|nr:hypothetical protein [Selenomonadales bacterium]
MVEADAARKLTAMIDRIDKLTTELERLGAMGEDPGETLLQLEEALENYRLFQQNRGKE